MLGCESMKKPQNKIMSHDDLLGLFYSHPPIETFGPKTEHLYIAFRLGAADIALAEWLKRLPCPVIGIGNGPMSQACDVTLPNDKMLPQIECNISKNPIAAMVLVQHLRASETQNLKDTLTAESFTYGTLQNGPEFKAWLSTHIREPLSISSSPSLNVERQDNRLSLTFNRPDTRNAIGTDMRDALCRALDMAIIDTSISKITLTGKGATFSTGGAVEEFGEVSDPATAHWVRSLRLPASRLVPLRDKFHVHINGAAIGAAIEIAAFGKYISASPKAWFQLPELKYGLIPGAGGTASITARIGRQKIAYMALSMKRIRAQRALDWGLIDAVID